MLNLVLFIEYLIEQRSIHGEDEDEENSLSNDSKQLMVVNDQFRAQHLRSCMEQLDEEVYFIKLLIINSLYKSSYILSIYIFFSWKK